MAEVTREEMIEALRERVAHLEYHRGRGPLGKRLHELECMRAALRELEAGGWQSRATAPDTDEPILGYSPIAGDLAEDEQSGHYAITEGSFLRQGGWKNCTLWRSISPPGTSDGSDK